jgi:hypothetical protein
VIEESSVGRIQIGLTTLAPTERVPDVIVLANPQGERPLGAGIHSDGAYVAFKNMWDFIPEKGALKLQKTTVVGSAGDLSSFQKTMSDEMLNSRAGAFRMGARTADELSLYFDFVEIDAAGRALVQKNGKSVELQRVENPLHDEASVGFILKDQGREVATRIAYNTGLRESVEQVAALIAEREAAGKFYMDQPNRPSLQFLGTANLLAPEDNSCKVYHDGRGHMTVLDFGISLPRFIEKGANPDQIDTLVLTHPHADHLVGLPDLLAYRTSRLADGGKTLRLVTNEYTAETLFKQVEAVLGAEQSAQIRRGLELVVLESVDSLGYKPVEIDGTRLEAFNVRHSVEDRSGNSVTLGFKLTGSYMEDGVHKAAAYADSGDTQIGSRYLRHERALLRSAQDLRAFGSESAPVVGDAFYKEILPVLNQIKGYARVSDRPAIDSLMADAAASGWNNEQFATVREMIAEEIAVVNGAILSNNEFDLKLFEMMKRENSEVKQLNYVDLGGGAGMLPAETLELADGTKIEGKAGIVHSSSSDGNYLYARISDSGATWVAGHCKSDTAVQAPYVTANPGKGQECQVVDIRTGAITKIDMTM